MFSLVQITIFEAAIKIFIFVLCAVSVFWLLANCVRRRLLRPGEAAIGFTLLGVGVSFGALSLLLNGWDFVGLLGSIYMVLLALVCWPYALLKRRHSRRVFNEIDQYIEALRRDPSALGSCHYEGRNSLRLNAPCASRYLEKSKQNAADRAA